MHEWKTGDLGIVKDVEAQQATLDPGTVVQYETQQAIFKPGTVVRYAGIVGSGGGVGYWRIVFGPEPSHRRWLDNGRIDAWAEHTKFIDPLPDGDE